MDFIKNNRLDEKIKPFAFYLIFFLFILAFSTTSNGYDYDFWARLIAGMAFIQTGHILKQDFLSYTPTHTWYDHEWGSGVIFYLVQHLFSNVGILLLQTTLIFLIFFMITKVVELRGVKTTSAFNFLFYYFAFIAMSQILNEPVRCQLFTFLFFTVFLYILELARRGQNKRLWLMPIIMIFWNNLHGGCVSGIGLILIYIIGEFFNKKPVKKYVLPLILSILVLPINPWGFKYLGFLLSATTMQRPDIMEWWGLFSKHNIINYMKFKFFALFILLAQTGLIIKNLKSKNFSFDKTKFLVLMVTLLISFEHVKMIPFFVISATCFLYDDFYSVFNSITKNFFNKIAKPKDMVIYGLILLFALSNINSKIFQPILTWDKYPIKSVEFIKINNIKGDLLINFGLGSYASYKLYPNNKIYMDGRYEEVYYDYMIPLLKKFYLVIGDWREVLKLFPPEVIIIEKYYPVYNALLASKEWKLMYDGDKDFGVFVKSKDAKEIKTAYKLPSNDLNYYKETLFDTDIKFKPLGN